MNIKYIVEFEEKTYFYLKNELILKSDMLEWDIKQCLSGKTPSRKSELKLMQIELEKVNKALECFENNCTICE